MNHQAVNEEVLAKTLARYGRSEMWTKIFIGIVAVVEAGGLTACFLIMDLDDRLHWLVLIAACLVYGTTVCSVFAMGAHSNTNTRRILEAMELVHERLDHLEKEPSKTDAA